MSYEYLEDVTVESSKHRPRWQNSNYIYYNYLLAIVHSWLLSTATIGVAIGLTQSSL